MLGNKISDMLNNQVARELESAYLYLAFSNYFSEKGLEGFSHWYRVQAEEEIIHAMKFVDYIHGCGEQVELKALDLDEADYSSDREVLRQGLSHERYVTALINSICEEAEKTKDFRTREFLTWFVNEQAEEERNAQALIDSYENFALDCGCGLYALNREMAERSKSC